MTTSYLHEIHSCLLPSEATCFNALRVCRGQNGNFVKLSTMKQMSCELVSSSRAPFKIVTPKKAASVSPPPPPPASAVAASSALSAPSSGFDETELIVSNDVIGGDGEDWEDWSYLGGSCSAVEAIAVRRIKRRAPSAPSHEDGDNSPPPSTPAAGTEESSVFLLYVLRNVQQHQVQKQQERAVGRKSARPSEAGAAAASTAAAAPNPDRQVIQLNYSPLVLHLTYLPRSSVMTLSLLVSSNDDSSIRLYQPLGSNNGPFEEVTDMDVKEKMLPNFWSSFPAPILTIDTTMTYDPEDNVYSNYAAVGCKDGYIRVVSFNPRRLQARTFSFYVDGPISAVQLRTRKSVVRKGTLSDAAVHLNVASLSGFACIYRQDVVCFGRGGGGGEGGTEDGGETSAADGEGRYSNVRDFVGPDVLEETVDEDDPVMCIYEASFPTLAGSCVLVGTYNGRLMIFEEGRATGEASEQQQLIPGDGTSSPPLPTSRAKRAVLCGSRTLPHPIYKLGVGDMNSDGIPEVVVLTKSAVHVFARSFGDLADVALLKLRTIALKKTSPERDDEA